MGQREKQYQRMMNNPRDVTFEDLKGLLLWLGYELKDGPHPLFVHTSIDSSIRLSKRHRKQGGNTLLPVYVEAAIDEIENHPELWQRRKG